MRYEYRNKHTVEEPGMIILGMIIDKALDKYSGQVLCPEQVAKAKNMLKGVEFPKKS